MYSVAPSAGTAWRRLLGHAIARAGIGMEVIDHPPPAGLPELWSRPDLGCAFMCGWPFAREGGVRPIVAAPVPLGETGPVYRAEFVVAAASPFRALDDVLGRRFAFNARHSHSGWNLPCAHLAAIGAPPFTALAGPFVTHQASIAAVVAGHADVACIDSYVLALMRRHDPDLAARIRSIGVTSDSPIPLLVGAAPLHGDPLGPDARTMLRGALLALGDDTIGRELLADLALHGFVVSNPADYAVTLGIEAAAEHYIRYATALETAPATAGLPSREHAARHPRLNNVTPVR